MANNVTLHQKNKDGAYDNIYPRTTADHTMLTSATGNKYGLTDGNAEQAVSISMDFISTIGAISMYVFDPLGNPVEGAVINGLSGNPSTNASGFVQGTVVANPVTVKSPYVDLKDQSVNVTSYVGTTTAMRVTLESLGENGIVRFTRSTNVKFSHVAKTVDVCCVGGGGGGGQSANKQTTTYEFNGGGAGGGGGGIVNSYGINVSADTSYSISIGNGGGIEGTGGTTTFLSVSAPGGTGGSRSGDYPYIEQVAGLAGIAGCGNGGHYGAGGSNTTVSEFDDGKTFYSGGGGAGVGERVATENNKFKGGSPNGASGAIAGQMNTAKAGVAGIGGGGGGAAYYHNSSGATINNDIRAGSGGSGLVAIRIHLS